MINQWGTPEEELIREAALCPRLSADLRDRVLDAALRSRRRYVLRRSAMWAACLLLSVTGAASWHYGVQGFGRGDADPFAQPGDASSGESAWPAGRARGIQLDMQGFPTVWPGEDSQRSLPWLDPESKSSEERSDSSRDSVARPDQRDGRGRPQPRPSEDSGRATQPLR